MPRRDSDRAQTDPAQAAAHRQYLGEIGSDGLAVAGQIGARQESLPWQHGLDREFIVLRVMLASHPVATDDRLFTALRARLMVLTGSVANFEAPAVSCHHGGFKRGGSCVVG
ncbi:MAG: hypothetical protein IPG25_13665 [Proteobacteria bacterium]|nr:hypothetical protein [Pseudomonadota bacterium]